jgi:excisionase family DNA binding protein
LALSGNRLTLVLLGSTIKIMRVTAHRTDAPLTSAQRPWTTTDLARWTGMSADFVLDEIRVGELHASRFGRHFRIAFPEVLRYLREKGFSLPSGEPPHTLDPPQPLSRKTALTRA